LLIRAAQLEQMGSTLETLFVRRVVEHLVKDLSTECDRQGLRSEQMEVFVRGQIRRARRYGLVNANDLKTYVDCAVIFGQHFDGDPKIPWGAAVLGRQDLQGSAKGEILHDHLTFSR
jgi:hypothetical protein